MSLQRDVGGWESSLPTRMIQSVGARTDMTHQHHNSLFDWTVVHPDVVFQDSGSSLQVLLEHLMPKVVFPIVLPLHRERRGNKQIQISTTCEHNYFLPNNLEKHLNPERTRPGTVFLSASFTFWIISYVIRSATSPPTTRRLAAARNRFCTRA